MASYVKQTWVDNDTTKPLSAARMGHIEDGLAVADARVPERTIDTNQEYKLILLGDGTVKAIPKDVVPPLAPTNLARQIRLTSVNLTWTAALFAHHYLILRDGSPLATTTDVSYRDTTVIANNTYSYQVATYDQYGQRSPNSTAVTAFVDPALNMAPTVAIRCWPPTIPTNGVAIVRVCSRDIDTQLLAYTLDVSEGSLQPTPDPSVWILTI